MAHISKMQKALFLPRRLRGWVVFAAFFMFALTPLAARADCTSPAGAAGMMIYNDDFHIVQFCNGTNWMGMSGGSGGSASANGTSGSVQFAGASNVFASDSTNFFWDNTNHRLGIGTNTPAQALDVSGTATINTVNFKSVTGASAPGAGNNYQRQIMIVRDEKPDGTNGGAGIAGTQTRTLNTTQYNSITGASLNTSTSVVTLPAGTYYIRAAAPVHAVDYQQVRIYNVTGSTALLMGMSTYAVSTNYGDSMGTVEGVVTLAGTTQIRLEQSTYAAHATDGLGDATPATFGVEVYATMTIEKLP